MVIFIYKQQNVTRGFLYVTIYVDYKSLVIRLVVYEAQNDKLRAFYSISTDKLPDKKYA